MQTSNSRALAYGLLAGAAGIALLSLAWLAVSGARGGGIVLGLMLAFVIAGPLAGLGWYTLARSRVEAVEETAFSGKRRVLEADRLFRRELAAELRQLARRPELPAARLSDLAEDLERPSYDAAEWYDTVSLADADVSALRQYDDLVWERVRRLGQQADGPASADELAALEEALGQRRDLLLRGRRAPTAAPSAILRAGTPASGAGAIADLAVGDAVTLEGQDFLAEGVATSFAEGRTWKLVHLVPSGPGARERWLYVGPGGLDVAALDELPSPGTPGTAPVVVDGELLRIVERGTATVDVASRGGSARGVLVAYVRYQGEGDGRIALAESWPDGAVHAYGGRIIRASDLEVWPSARDAGG